MNNINNQSGMGTPKQAEGKFIPAFLSYIAAVFH
jgi:hypothetical protein